jgi:aspartate/methionine/tyrosine aminotransferase
MEGWGPEWEVAARLLADARVVTVPGRLRADGYLRISYGASR